MRRIVVEGGRVRGVELTDGQRMAADTVVCNADVLEAFSTLIDAEHRPHWPARRVAAMDPGGSGLILLLGIEGRYEQLAHHTKFMPEDYREDLRSMTGGGVPADPCIYVCASTKSDPTQAPEGCENLFVLVSAPALGGRRPVDWSVEGPRYAARVIDTLERRFGLEGLSRRIVVKRLLTPADLHGLYGAYRGSIYGVGSNSRRDAFMRPPNRDPKIGGLYFAGGSTHPGGGLPLVALSGKIVAEAV